ncbi:hypothetical protein [Yersinia entomophaga]|uniref:hypothetical protein n=1 Tax=Yersinia TaxID=629 RepID=UPI00090066FB|nr:hypothetical protein B4914_10025 [Yersinia entomophaga]
MFQCLEKNPCSRFAFSLEEYLTNYCWKRDQSNTLPIDRKESKAICAILILTQPPYPAVHLLP